MALKDLEFDSIDVLAHILRRCLAKGYDCGYTKAQKLLYCCYGSILGLYGVRLTIEHPKCWQLGPVFPRSYNAHKKGRINNNANDPIIDAPEWVSFVVDNAIDYFGSWTANQLVLWTHGIDTPWYVSSMGGADLYKDVNDNLIANYFKKITTLGKDDPRPENGI